MERAAFLSPVCLLRLLLDRPLQLLSLFSLKLVLNRLLLLHDRSVVRFLGGLGRRGSFSLHAQFLGHRIRESLEELLLGRSIFLVHQSVLGFLDLLLL